MPGPGVVIETACWAGSAANTGAAVERGGMTGLGRATADGLDETGREDSGADNLDKGGATAGDTVDENAAGVGVPAANLIVVRAEPRAGAHVPPWKTRAGTLPSRGGDETRVGVPTGGDAKGPACAAGSLGRADTTFVLLGNHVEPRPGIPVSRTGVTFGVVASNDGPTAKGELITGTPGILAGDWGKSGARGASMT